MMQRYFVYVACLVLLNNFSVINADYDSGLGDCYGEVTNCNKDMINARGQKRITCIQHGSGWSGSWKKWGDDDETCYQHGPSGTGYQYDDCRDDGLILPTITQTVAYKNMFGAWIEDGTNECIKRTDPRGEIGVCFLDMPNQPTNCDFFYANEMTKSQCFWHDGIQHWRPGTYDFANPTIGIENCVVEGQEVPPPPPVEEVAAAPVEEAAPPVEEAAALVEESAPTE